ncbi:MAG TPA: hybrid sensor histidine kinase/response regulator, partial [Alcanivorax sp.]|nr:hybrid sensor histidine kinase/response regulator [Alcanivorax sp.]
MAHSSLRTRILVMTALPAFLAALVIGGYTLVHRMVEVRADTAHRQQLIIESYAARLAALGEAEQPAYEPLLRALLEEPDVRAASLLDNQSGWQSHAGPRLRPVQEAERLEGGGRRLVTDSSWQLVRALPGQRNRLLTVEFSRQGQYIEILEAVLTMIAVVVVLVLL